MRAAPTSQYASQLYPCDGRGCHPSRLALIVIAQRVNSLRTRGWQRTIVAGHCRSASPRRRAWHSDVAGRERSGRKPPWHDSFPASLDAVVLMGWISRTRRWARSSRRCNGLIASSIAERGRGIGHPTCHPNATPTTVAERAGLRGNVGTARSCAIVIPSDCHVLTLPRLEWRENPGSRAMGPETES